MKHDLRAEGLAYRLRPIRIDDAQFIIDIRLEDQERNQYIHAISPDLVLQEQWLASYFEREGDYYFVVENKLTGAAEGLVGVYDLDDSKAEWGRWVIKKGSFASAESLDLLYRIAFNDLNLEQLYCRTIVDNESVVSLHDSLPQIRREVLKNFLQVNDVKYDVVEHYVTPAHFYNEIAPDLEKKVMMVFQRNLRSLIGALEFHHIGIACNSIVAELSPYRFLGYVREGAAFEDVEQGIRGQFITAPGQPRLELLENIEGSATLDIWLNNRVKMYHFAFKTKNIEEAVTILNKNRIRTVTPLKTSVYFKKRICFLLLSPGFLIELIED